MELGENSSSTADEARKNKLLYNTMLDAVRRAMYGAHWDFSKGIKQSPEVMSKVYTEAGGLSVS
ncbi:hypothetical protein FRC03_007094 [Tulasnella sp. 419]|nr:hypothetical protein FRC03_007094 [Tulasnella sp. 419]